MRIIKIVIIILCVIIFPSFSVTINIAHIDNSMLLVNQQVRVYISVIDKDGYPVKGLTSKHFKLFEEGEKKEIQLFKRGVNINRGVKFLLLIDNSGSMYQDSSGKKTENKNDQRITYAKNAVQSLLKQIKNPLDRIGLTTFNVRLGKVTGLTSKNVLIEKALSEIKKPEGDELYTELYESLNESVDYFRSVGGRKVIILLSDGENFELKNNPYYSERAGLNKTIQANQEEGISVFTIGLIQTENKALKKIAEQTGGRYFPANKPEELETLYSLIRNQVLNEYLIGYNASMTPLQKRLIKIQYEIDEQIVKSERYYYSETLFGKPQEALNFWLFLAIPFSIVLIWIISLLKFENRERNPSLNVLKVGNKKSKIRPLTITQDQKEIVIGGSLDSDLTITGDADVALTEAVIENKNGVYTINTTKQQITVNNKAYKRKKLRPGDVIQVGNTTIVFDDGIKKG